ncbi:MAG: DUF4105 domain-containing protein [Sideroxydans sp.]|nr:DUF4105 domain-containing protein [Sideroxydans sp.]
MLPATHWIKSGFIAAFLFLCIHSAAAAPTDAEALIAKLNLKATQQHLARSSVWQALLHANTTHHNISDQSFLLSLPNFSLAAELQHTLVFLYSGDTSHVCRFPARYVWLRQQLDAPELSLDACPDVIEFRRKAPVDEIALAFASERIAEPASMLGHAFLKLSGKNSEGLSVSHAITFYTDANTLNLPKLLFDSIVTGKPGYFSLTPYAEQQQRYVDEEQRNLWEYTLELSGEQIELIRLHLLELKQTSLTYFFQKYNCATVLNYILAVSGKTIATNDWTLTPNDLIKHAQHAGLIRETRVITPSRWLFLNLSHQVDASQRDALVAHVKQGTASDYVAQQVGNSAYLNLELARAYNQYAYLTQHLEQARWLNNEADLTKLKQQRFATFSLSSNNRYDPINTPADSQVTVGLLHDKNGASINLTLLPVSHTLHDDNRAYSTESSLQLFSTTLKILTRSRQIELEQLTIFEMQSLQPYTPITGGAASRFRLAIEMQKDKQLLMHRVFAMSGGYGLNQRVTDDIDMYALLGGGISYTGVGSFFYTTLESGAIIREVWDMKSALLLTRTDRQFAANSHYYTVSLNQVKFLTSDTSINFHWQRDFNQSQQQHRIAFSLKRLF